MAVSAFREITRAREPEFLSRGYRPRHVFAHRLYQLPKCGPDGYKLATQARDYTDLAGHWQLILYADASMVEDLPREIFFDDDVMWHRQQLARTGQVASATVFFDGNDSYSLVHQSDLVQRIGRIPEFRSRVQNRFKGWPRMLLNGLLAFAAERGSARLFTPTADLALRHTDPARDPGPELFERVYDRPVQHFRPERRNSWWAIDVEANAGAIVVPERKVEPLPERHTVVVCHDIEHGCGHLDVDAGFARQADLHGRRRLERMLAIEDGEGISATYNVVGKLMDEVRADLRDTSHCVAFHSYDHRLPADGEDDDGAAADQLALCRAVDYRIQGYRTPRSLIPESLTDEALAFHNFEWLASSAWSLGADTPALDNRVAKLPISVDDFALYTGELTYDEWLKEVLEKVASEPFTAVCLHDCYADLWLPGYQAFLEQVTALAEPRTLDAVAGDLFLASAA